MAAWRASAAQDLRIAAAFVDDESNVACFHAQQAGEKALKAASVAAIDDVARINVLASLLDARDALALARTVLDDADRIVADAFDAPPDARA